MTRVLQTAAAWLVSLLASVPSMAQQEPAPDGDATEDYLALVERYSKIDRLRLRGTIRHRIQWHSGESFEPTSGPTSYRLDYQRRISSWEVIERGLLVRHVLRNKEGRWVLDPATRTYESHPRFEEALHLIRLGSVLAGLSEGPPPARKVLSVRRRSSNVSAELAGLVVRFENAREEYWFDGDHRLFAWTVVHHDEEVAITTHMLLHSCEFPEPEEMDFPLTPPDDYSEGHVRFSLQPFYHLDAVPMKPEDADD